MQPTQTSSRMGAEKGMASADEMVDQAKGAAGKAKAVAREQMGRLEDAIRANPIQAAGIAAGIGFLLAMIARR